MMVIIVVTGEKYRNETVSKIVQKDSPSDGSVDGRMSLVRLADLNLMRPKSVRVEILSGNEKDNDFLIS